MLVWENTKEGHSNFPHKPTIPPSIPFFFGGGGAGKRAIFVGPRLPDEPSGAIRLQAEDSQEGDHALLRADRTRICATSGAGA